jgi:hypothetical protein
MAGFLRTTCNIASRLDHDAAAGARDQPDAATRSVSRNSPASRLNGGTLRRPSGRRVGEHPVTGGSPTDGGIDHPGEGGDILLADDGQVTIDASREASLQMDTAPDSPPTASTTTGLAVAAQHDGDQGRALHQLGEASSRSTSVAYIRERVWTRSYPMRTKPLVAPDGAIYYQLSADNLAGHRRPHHHGPGERDHPRYDGPVLSSAVRGFSADGLRSRRAQGLSIQRNSTAFFQNGSQPSGILTAPGNIDPADAERLKAHWEAKYTGANAGKVAVVGSGLKYEAMTINAVDAQLIEQLKWSAETVCSCFHVPAYMVGVGAAPLNNNAQVLREQYYAQCLQALIEAIEISLDEGLGLGNVTGHSYGSQFDLDPLLRMDTPTHTRRSLMGSAAAFSRRTRAVARSISSPCRAAIRRICSSRTTASRRWTSATVRMIRSRPKRRLRLLSHRPPTTTFQTIKSTLRRPCLHGK